MDPQQLRERVQALLGPRGRLHHPDAMERAQASVAESFSRAGWQVHPQPFSVPRGVGIRDFGDFGRKVHRDLTGANLLAVKPGEVSASLVVLAHLDTVRDSPGADDNTASVVALVEAARLLATEDLHHTVVLAVTDFEEIGLFGARALLPLLRRHWPPLGAINLETIAYVDRRPGGQRLPGGVGLLYPRQVKALAARGTPGDFTALIGDRRARRLSAAYAAALTQSAGGEVPVELPLPVPRGRAPFLLMYSVPLLRNFVRGDHAVFWQAGIPALQVTDTANFRHPGYHGPGDTPERLDYDRLAALVAATAATVRSLAGPRLGPATA